MMRKIEIYQFKHKLRREANLADLEQIKHSQEKLQSKEEEREKKQSHLKGKTKISAQRLFTEITRKVKQNQYMMYDTGESTMEN